VGRPNAEKKTYVVRSAPKKKKTPMCFEGLSPLVPKGSRAGTGRTETGQGVSPEKAWGKRLNGRKFSKKNRTRFFGAGHSKVFEDFLEGRSQCRRQLIK